MFLLFICVGAAERVDPEDTAEEIKLIQNNKP